MNEQLLISVTDARKTLGGLGVTKFYELANDPSNPISIKKIGTRSLVLASDIAEFVSGLPEKESSAA